MRSRLPLGSRKAQSRLPGRGFGLPSPRILGFGGGLRKPEEARQAFDGRPVALDLYLSGPEGFVEVAVLVDERGERVYVRSILASGSAGAPR
jgi:hypothetical protein